MAKYVKVVPIVNTTSTSTLTWVMSSSDSTATYTCEYTYIHAASAAVTAMALVLSVNPDSFVMQFQANPDNAQMQVVIQNDKGTTPYQQFYTAEIDEGQSILVIPRHDHLPPGDYTIQATIMRWADNQLIPFESSQSVPVHVP